MSKPCIVVLAGDGPSTRAVCQLLRARFAARARVEVVLESPVPRSQLLRRRLRRLGWPAVLGQVLFMAAAAPVLRVRSRRRIAGIVASTGMSGAPVPPPVHRVRSANDDETQGLLRSLGPSVVVVNGTRILSAATLRSVAAPFINLHAGITPRYRGVHGGYWALAEGRPDLVGSTVHLIDEGIDTGGVIEQVFFDVTEDDNFCTYPFLHTAAGGPALVRAVEAALEGRLEVLPAPAVDESRLRHHPTLWAYIRTGLTAGVW